MSEVASDSNGLGGSSTVSSTLSRIPRLSANNRKRSCSWEGTGLQEKESGDYKREREDKRADARLQRLQETAC